MRHRARIPEALTAVLVALLMASCAGIEEPKVTLTGLDFHGLSSEGLELKLLADVENPNGFGADVSGLEYSVYLDDLRVARGVQTGVTAVAARSTVEVEIPFTLVWKGAGEGLQKMLDGKKHDWRLDGRVRLSKGSIARTFRFSESGTFDAPDVDEIEIDL
jgi:LEA14-like dessication related protein